MTNFSLRGRHDFRHTCSALVALAVSIIAARGAWAHQDPPGCSGTAVQLSFTAYRADGTPIDLSESVTECETITYQVVIGKSTIGNPCAFQGGQITITTPDGIVHDVTPGGGVPCIGGTAGCSTTQVASNTVNYTVNPGDVMGGAVTAGSSYVAQLAHTGTVHTMGFPKASTTIPLEVMFCPADTPCVDNFCDPFLFDSATGALGNCTFANVPDSTPCPDVDGNQCTFAGCNGSGTCDQNHLVTTCPPDGNPCTNDLGCDSASGACVYTPKPDSTPCPDSDGSLCTHAGCDSGVCNQNHMTTVCPPDNNPCTNDLGCDSSTGACVYTPVPDSTPCPDTDGIACTTAGCDAGTCNQSHILNNCGIDHFECYQVHKFPFAGPALTLVDKFGTFTNVPLQRPERLCNPADKNDEDNSAPTHPDHLLGYKVRYTFGGSLSRQVTDQLGTHALDVTKPDRLFMPAAKSTSGPPPALTPPIIDHFTCYKVRRPRGTAAFVPVTVKIDDQFGTMNSVKLRKPYRLCVPTDKNGETPGAETHTQNLLCYKTSGNARLAPLNVSVRDQIGLQTIELQEHREFCLPATDP